MICECGCKQIGNEYFCGTCGHNFNSRDCSYALVQQGILAAYFCPKCYPEGRDPLIGPWEKVK